MGDFNGDGKTDLAVANGSNIGEHPAGNSGSASGIRRRDLFGWPLDLRADADPDGHGQCSGPGHGTPTGTVTFYDGATPLSAPVTLANGIAVFTTSGLSVAIIR